MAGNAVEAALNRASEEQRAKAQQVIEEARRNIKLVSMRDDIPPSEIAAQQTQIIEEAKRNIPFETMQEVDEISPPLPTPSTKEADPKVVQLHPQTQETIERIEQGEGNNYLRENAVDRAVERQSQETPPLEQQQEQQRAMGR